MFFTVYLKHLYFLSKTPQQIDSSLWPIIESGTISPQTQLSTVSDMVCDEHKVGRQPDLAVDTEQSNYCWVKNYQTSFYRRLLLEQTAVLFGLNSPKTFLSVLYCKFHAKKLSTFIYNT